MKFRMLFTSLSIIALASVAFVKPATAADQVPFKGTMQGSYTRTGTFPFFHLEPVGEGTASHLGSYVFSIPHDVNLLLTPPAGDGNFEFIAANGDTICGTFTTQATAIPEMPGFILGDEYMTITGGTGRFENATGSFHTTRLIDTVNLTTTGSFVGTLSSPGAN